MVKLKQIGKTETREIKLPNGETRKIEAGIIEINNPRIINYLCSLRAKRRYGFKFHRIQEYVPYNKEKPIDESYFEPIDQEDIQQNPYDLLPYNPNILFYTAIFGGHDLLRNHKFQKDNHKYICYTDDKHLKSNYYDIILLDDKKKKSKDSTRIARYVKYQIHKIYDTSKYDYCIWLDANCYFIFNVDDLLRDLGSDLISIFRHDERICAYREADAVIKLGKSESVKVIQQMERYREEGFPEKFGLWATHCLVFKPCEELFKFFDMVYGEIESNSKRCQLAVPYSIYKTKIPFHSTMNCCLNSNTWRKYIIKERHLNVRNHK